MFDINFIENHRTQTEYDDALILKLFAFQFVNSYTSLFYIAFFRTVRASNRDSTVYTGNMLIVLSSMDNVELLKRFLYI